MNTLKDLLDAAAPNDVPFVDAGTDVTRGRALLRRRRTRRGVLAGAGIAVAATVSAFLVPTGAPGAPAVVATATGTPGRSASDPRASDPAALSIRLVAYTGEQPAGYGLATIPQGWEVAEADKTALVLARAGTDGSGDWLDKILVMGDLNGLDLDAYGDRPVRVGGQPGRLQVDGDRIRGVVFTAPGNASRTVTDPPGKGGEPGPRTVPLRVVVQLPPEIDWDEETVLGFAEGVSVSADAGGGVG